MTILMQASRQWATRPADERYASLLDMQSYMRRRRDRSRAAVESTRALTVVPDQNDALHRGLFLGIERGPLAGQLLAPTHQAFGQICSLAATPSPASYFRESRVPADIIADALNFNLRFSRDVEEVGVLATMGDEDSSLGVPTGSELRAATGPAYGRIWDADIVDALVERFGDGVSGHWRVPGEFGNRITVTKENTTLFASDRDMFVFLADEENRIELPGRRAGRSGSFARGFFVWNSEVGKTTLGAGFFLFDYVCCNRIIWGADQYTEVRIRHTKGAPDRWLDEVTPVLREYSQASAKPVVQAIEDARNKHVEANLDQFLANRFGKRMVAPIKAIHEHEEGRPIETFWDVTVAATAHARSFKNTDARLDIERTAGELLKLAA